MKHVDEYRDPRRLQDELEQIRRRAARRWTIMDVCGGQTHQLLRHGLEAALEDSLELIHGPGCPVCVTPAEAIDDAVELALDRGALVASFGDMLRVPGRRGSLLQARARLRGASGGGGEVRTVHAPSEAVRLAERFPDREVVFFAVGFETTVPSTALAVLQAAQLRLRNFSLLAHHVRVVPAMEALAADPSCRISGFLAAGHVCTVTGYRELGPLVERHRVPVVVTGFEPLDLVHGLRLCIEQLETGRAELENGYPRCVRLEGNPAALRLIDRVYSVCDLAWRGFGVLRGGGFEMRSEYAAYDARKKFALVPSIAAFDDPAEKECAAVLSGRIKPPQCPWFGAGCTPDSPRGAPMVSEEGACAAYHRYARRQEPARG